MKKTIAIVLTAVLVLSVMALTACGASPSVKAAESLSTQFGEISDRFAELNQMFIDQDVATNYPEVVEGWGLIQSSIIEIGTQVSDNLSSLSDDQIAEIQEQLTILSDSVEAYASQYLVME